MRESKFSESQMVGILKEADAGVPVAELLRKHGLSKAFKVGRRGIRRASLLTSQGHRSETWSGAASPRACA
jgi:hypothetical protein